MNFNILEKMKIEPKQSKSISINAKTFSFRGVREGLGATTLLNHVALNLASKGLSVCVLDLDFASPNSAFSKQKMYSIIAKLNRQQESIMNILNNTDYSGINYIGPSLSETVLDYLPTIIDEAYVNGRGQAVTVLFSELSKKFDAILVDLPSDIRLIECSYAIMLSDVNYTLCKVSPSYISKLQRDAAVMSAMIPDKPLSKVINVYEDIDSEEIYASASKDFKLITDMTWSPTIAEAALNGKIRHVRKNESCDNLEEIMYYHAIKAIISDMRGTNND